MKKHKELFYIFLIISIFSSLFALLAMFLMRIHFSMIIKSNNTTKVETENLLFKYSYISHGRYNISYGFYIFNDGKIKEYDDYDKSRKLKKDQLDEEEIQKLYELSTLVKDEFETDKSVPIHDIGISTTQIYNEKLSKWVMLTSGGDSLGRNSTKESEEILDLIKKITKKYLDDEKYSI